MDDVGEIEEQLEAISSSILNVDESEVSTLHHLIDVLASSGGQESSNNNNDNNDDNNNNKKNDIGNGSSSGSSCSTEQLLNSNPAYLKLKQQQKVVSRAIKTITDNHYAELNASVVAMGRVTRQFSDALLEVKEMRKQVRSVQGALEKGFEHEPGAASSATLSELYRSKMESDAKLQIVAKVSYDQGHHLSRVFPLPLQVTASRARSFALALPSLPRPA